MTGKPLLPLPLLALALTASGCGQPTAGVDAATARSSRDEGAAQIAHEQAAEADVTTQVTLARLSKEVADLHVEVDELKAGKAALSDQMLAARLQALEARAAQAPDPGAPVPTPLPAPAAAPSKPAAQRRSTPATAYEKKAPPRKAVDPATGQAR